MPITSNPLCAAIDWSDSTTPTAWAYLALVGGGVIVFLAVLAIARKYDVRLVLIIASLGLGALAGEPFEIVRTFLVYLTYEQFVVPICTAMGFAYVLRHTGCDQNLVLVLIQPFRKVRFLLIPGTVLVGFWVNISVISQASTVAAIGPVLVPLLRAARISSLTIGAALLLGCSIGGELLNPAAPELLTVSKALQIDSRECVRHVFPLMMLHLGLAVPIFWWICARAEARSAEQQEEEPAPDKEPVRINYLKAAVPLLPVTLLFLASPPLEWIEVPRDWLVSSTETLADPRATFATRQIGLAMLIGTVAAALSGGKLALESAGAFFDGAAFAYGRVISLIACAACFGRGIKDIGLAGLLGRAIQAWPLTLIPTAGGLSLAFAWLTGSGMATTQSLFEFFVGPARNLGVDPLEVGAVVPIAAAAGRTMSPVAAVTLLASTLTETNPLELARRVALPLLAGIAGVLVVATIWALAG